MAPLVLSLSVLGCGTVAIKNEKFYANKGVLGAVAFDTLDAKQTELTLEQWMGLLRTESLICSSVSTFGDIKAAVEQLCSVCNCCDYTDTAAAALFFDNMTKAAAQMKHPQ
jgi:hypothetical protein